jgi:translation initiation factor 2B subunit (eIF-2B alpha/beta/delta family)
MLEAYPLPGEYARLVEDVRRGRVRSSTECVLRALDALAQALEGGGAQLFARLAVEVVRARPTSALMVNAVRSLLEAAVSAAGGGLEEVRLAVRRRAREVRETLMQHVERAAGIAERRLEDGDTVLTNTYSLFVKKTILRAAERGKALRVIVAESRPGGEGVQLAVELADAEVPTQLVVDSAVRYVMREVDKVLLASEAIAANGANVSKVGSSLIALAAYEARVRVFVVVTSLKISPETLVGELLEIPEADYPVDLPAEQPLRVRAPLFDVTPPRMIDAIVTEKGLIAPEFVVMIAKEMYGWPPALASIPELSESFLRALGERG